MNMRISLTKVAPSQSGGQSLVEFALALPIFALLVFGLIDGGRLVIEYTTLANASREGARVAIVNQSNDATDCVSVRTFKCAAVDHGGAFGVTSAEIDDLDALDSDTCETSGCDITVTVRHTWTPITPLASLIFDPFDLEASTTMPVERLFADPE